MSAFLQQVAPTGGLRFYAGLQKARENGFGSDGGRIDAGDAQRRARTGEPIAVDALCNRDDFYHAAYVCRHGDRPEAYLKAHALAMAAVAKARSDAT